MCMGSLHVCVGVGVSLLWYSDVSLAMIINPRVFFCCR